MANVVANNTDDGIAVTDFGSLNTISGNSIFANGGLGIDLDDDGVPANDPGDFDVRTNDLQNHPVLSSADAGTASVSGTLDGADGEEHVVELFSSSGCDGSGQGEGEVFLGSGTVVTDGGAVAFSIPVTVGFQGGSEITATATNSGGSTSELSACVTATGVPTPIFSDGFESGDTTAWSSAVE